MTLAIETPTVSPAVAERLALEPHVYVDGKAEAPLSGERCPCWDPATGRTIAHRRIGRRGRCRPRRGGCDTRAFDPASEWRRMSPIDRGRVLHRIGTHLSTRPTISPSWRSSTLARSAGGPRHRRRLRRSRLPLLRGVADQDRGLHRPRLPPGIHFARNGPGRGGRRDHRVELPTAAVRLEARPRRSAAGCTVVMKPSEETPLSTLWLAELAARPACRQAC